MRDCSAVGCGLGSPAERSRPERYLKSVAAASSCEELRKAIEHQNRAANKARMVAGYCWDGKNEKDSKAVDFVIP